MTWIVKIIGTSGVVRYSSGRFDTSDIRDAHYYTTYAGAVNRLEKLRAKVSRLPLAYRPKIDIEESKR